MSEFFINASPGFWMAVTIACIVSLLLVSRPSFFGLLLTTVASVMIGTFVYDLPIMSYVKNDFDMVTALFVSYVVTGIVWSFVRWMIHVRSAIKSVNPRVSIWKDEFDRTSNRAPVDRSMRVNTYMDSVGTSVPTADGFAKYCIKNDIHFERTVDINNHTEEVACWILWWPISMLDILLTQWLQDVAAWMVVTFKEVFSFISTSMTSKLYK